MNRNKSTGIGNRDLSDLPIWRRTTTLFIASAILLVFFFFIDIIWGSVKIPLNDIIHILLYDKGTGDIYEEILTEIRIPKAFGALFCGIALSISGLMMQTYFRNPLAGPYVLGISSGATLGMSVYLLLLPLTVSGINGIWTNCGIQTIQSGGIIAAIVGAFTLFLLIMTISLRLRNAVSLLIVGMLLAAASSAVVTILQNISDPDSVKIFVNWTLGSLSSLTPASLTVLLPTIIVGVTIAGLHHKQLDALLMGEEFASCIGVNIKSTRFFIMVATVLLTGITTAYTGPIGFIGMAVPHIARSLARSSVHRKVIPLTINVGGIAMLMSDLLSQMPRNGYVIPINAITALIGIPVILYIVLSKKRMY